MNDQSDSLEPSEIEANEVKVVPIDQIIVADGRGPLDEHKVAELMDSIQRLGLLQPILLVARQAETEEKQLHLVGGHHRFEAAKRLGLGTIQCTILECDEVLCVKLAEIDENLVRCSLTPAEHAILTQRRADIVLELDKLDGTLPQTATASTQALRRASVRDQARQTGQTKDKVQRSRKRSGILGSLLSKIVGTSLDSGTELDALAKLSKHEQENLANRAASGEQVSARTPDRKPRRKSERSKLSLREKALEDLNAWDLRYVSLPELLGYEKHISDLQVALMSPEQRPANYVPLPLLQEDDF